MAPDRRRRRGPRTLTDEERTLWQRVAETTDRGADEPRGEGIHRVPPEAVVQPDPANILKDAVADVVAPSLPRKVRPGRPLQGSTARVALTGAEVTPVGRPEAGLDRRTATRLRKGAREPDARIDLHGMSAERAHRACLTFLSNAMTQGCRVVLVITGKGRSSDDADRRGFGSEPRGRGVIRESLPGWLRASPLGRSIVGIYQAHQKHGGEGAFYIYLKRRR